MSLEGTHPLLLVVKSGLEKASRESCLLVEYHGPFVHAKSREAQIMAFIVINIGIVKRATGEGILPCNQHLEHS